MMRGKRPFASTVQAILIVLLVLSFVLIAQQVSMTVYHVGLVLLVVSTLVQIAFGNIPPSANLRRSLNGLGIGLAVISAMFGLGIILVPYLINLGRG
ncbi:MAG: hypothetical protein M1565_04960 [Actinobacteria bacterium]|nr:hypothetical protein [Actinomycetota bacterium]